MSLRSAGRTGAGSSDDRLADAFYPLYARLFGDDSDFVGTVETKLAEARVPRTVEIYLSRALGIGVLVGAALWLVGTAVGWAVVSFLITESPNFLNLPLPEPYLSIVERLKLPFIVVVSGLFFGSAGFGAGFGGLVGKPYLDASARKREINVLLSD